jgi:hypothetical protein
VVRDRAAGLRHHAARAADVVLQSRDGDRAIEEIEARLTGEV